ncbi:hypothetical protein SAMN05216354_2783 [Xylanibacter ruminicola]|uniref:Uncharacterized protein n=1 Tax=Xylanibacter ruminicola TaxID=839 RepID=A0A1H5XG76_XYLRU|nr:hypothetical protein SAMN05216354_2783 [Xylanibacter ruminicola]
MRYFVQKKRINEQKNTNSGDLYSNTNSSFNRHAHLFRRSVRAL